MRSRKQQVLSQYPAAKCFELWPQSALYLVSLDGTRPVVGTKEEYDASPGRYYATATDAWNAVITNPRQWRSYADQA